MLPGVLGVICYILTNQRTTPSLARLVMATRSSVFIRSMAAPELTNKYCTKSLRRLTPCDAVQTATEIVARDTG